MNKPMEVMPSITDCKEVYVAWTNTDLTEGRGWRIPLAVAYSEATAIRMGRKGSVMGSDCPVTKEVAVLINGEWLAPTAIHKPTDADTKADERKRQRMDALERAKAAGLTDDDIKLLQGAQP